jgi:hypothetical protein
MIRDKAELYNQPITIDLTGPEGNSFVLLGYAARIGKQMGMTKEAIAEIKKDMTSGDYEHLVNVFDKHFGECVVLYR